jgi:hypothetical protein
MLGTGRDFGYVTWEASRWRLAALLTPRSYALNLGVFGATSAQAYFRALLSLLAIAGRLCLQRGGVNSCVKPYRLLPVPRSALPRRVPRQERHFASVLDPHLS